MPPILTRASEQSSQISLEVNLFMMGYGHVRQILTQGVGWNSLSVKNYYIHLVQPYSRVPDFSWLCLSCLAKFIQLTKLPQTEP
jgi:hypothetical protein